jgi:epoxyqueuosine reductase
MIKNTMKSGKTMTSAEYNTLVSAIKSHNIELFGFCKYDDVLPLLPCRAVARLPLNSKSIIVCAFPYLVRANNKNISYYVCVPDYHTVAMDTLKALANDLKVHFSEYQFEPFVDSSPIREVLSAQLAGVGCVGKNGLIITEKYGSFVFLGEIVTDMPLDTSSYKKQCIGCGICQKECPTHSIKDGSICEDTCLSAITQKKGELSPMEKSLMVENHTAWGCDICQTVCPMNRNALETYIPEFINHAQHILTENNITKGGAYYWRGKKTILRNLEIIS